MAATQTRATKSLTDVTERLGNILTGLLDGIQAVQEAITSRTTPKDTKFRPHGLQNGLAALKQATDALYVLDCEARGVPVRFGASLIFGRR